MKIFGIVTAMVRKKIRVAEMSLSQTMTPYQLWGCYCVADDDPRPLYGGRLPLNE